MKNTTTTKFQSTADEQKSDRKQAKKDNYKIHESIFRFECCRSMRVKLCGHHVISHHARRRASRTAFFLTTMHHLNFAIPEIVI